jgi:hypothetical protein
MDDLALLERCTKRICREVTSSEVRSVVTIRNAA